MPPQDLCTALDQKLPYNDINFTYQEALSANAVIWLTAACSQTAATCTYDMNS